MSHACLPKDTGDTVLAIHSSCDYVLWLRINPGNMWHLKPWRQRLEMATDIGLHIIMLYVKISHYVATQLDT